MNPHQELIELVREKDFFIGIDSDGCAFDTMEIKHKECFCPNFIRHFEMQPVAKYAREAWEFVNLYSTGRGCNRFIAVIEVLKLLRERPEVRTRKFTVPDDSPLIKWVRSETKLGNPALIKYAAEAGDGFIDRTLEWSLEVNRDIEKMVYGISPFPYVRESLEKMAGTADIMVVSQTPLEALTREWRENSIDRFARAIAGQEHGSKTEHIKYAARGKYDDDKILMIGDAIGDLRAAKDNGVLFFPVNPGHEESSWERLFTESLDKFFAGCYKGDYEDSLISEFRSFLPESPQWHKKAY